MKSDEAAIKVEILLGHVKIDSFFRIEGEKIVGYGRATHYDQNGNITKVAESQTGIELRL